MPLSNRRGKRSVAFQSHGLKPEQISTTFNTIVNVKVDADGQARVEHPTSKPGDCIELRAEMAMACLSAEQSNNGSFKPIAYEMATLPFNCEGQSQLFIPRGRGQSDPNATGRIEIRSSRPRSSA